MITDFSILIVDDEEDVRESIKELLNRQGYEVDDASTGREALHKYQEKRFDVVVTDVVMPDMDGIELLQELKHIDEEAAVILITGYSSIKGAVDAIKMGAEDYFTKPFEPAEIKKVINRLYQKKHITEHNQRLKQEMLRREFPEIVGKSNAIKKVFSQIKMVADTDVSVLIAGESGTGKELVAAAIHSTGAREKESFVPINCAALPRDLLESELYGHEKGAFSGASERKYGLFEVAEKGTIFLDEIGEMPISLQAKLLRTIESKKIRRIGGTKEIHVDFRVISSTNRSLEHEIDEGRFRKDLYFRLSKFTIQIPPLRKRIDDIPLIVQDYFEKKSFRFDMISDDVLNAMMRYDWPGNVRELINVMDRLMILSNRERINPNHLPVEIRNVQKFRLKREMSVSDEISTLADIEKAHILKAYRLCNEDKVQTSKSLGIGLKTLYRKLKQYQTK